MTQFKRKFILTPFFIINMFKQNCIFDKEYMIELIQFLLTKTREYYVQAGKQNEVEEIKKQNEVKVEDKKYINIMYGSRNITDNNT